MASETKSTGEKIIALLQSANGQAISGQTLADSLGISRTAVWKQINQLKKQGYEIGSQTNSGYTLIKAIDPISPANILMNLKTKHIGQEIVYRDVVDSTQNLAKQLAAEETTKHGTVVIANEQQGGKGRLGRPWQSKPNLGLWLSLILKPNISPTEAAQFTLLAAVSVVETLRDFNIQATIKWPNDCLVDGKKIVGILTEMQADIQQVAYIVAGIGINVHHEQIDFAQEIAGIATSMRISGGKDFSRDLVASELLNRFEQLYDLYLAEGFSGIKSLWEKYAPIIGQKIRVVTLNEELIGRAVAIADDGALLVEKEDQQVEKVYAGDIYYD